MEKNYIQIAPSEGDVTLRDLLKKFGNWYNYLLSKWVIIITFSVFGALVGFTYCWLDKPVYTATTTFVLENSEGNSGGGLGQYAGIASMVGIDLGGGGGGIFQGDNIIELYKSRIMIQKTLLSKIGTKNRKELLIDRYIELNDLRKSWSKNAKLQKLHFGADDTSGTDLRLRDSILGTFVTQINNEYLKVTKPDKKLNIIKVAVSARDEFFAKTFNDEIVKNVNDFYVQTKTKKSLVNISILQQKTDSVRSIMNGAIYSSAAVSDATPNLNITRQVQRIAPMQRSQFNIETNKAILSELVKNLEMSKLSLLKETPLIQVVDQPVFPLEKKKLSKLLGIIVGGFAAGFIVTMVLIIKKIIKNIMV